MSWFWKASVVTNETKGGKHERLEKYGEARSQELAESQALNWIHERSATLRSYSVTVSTREALLGDL